MAIGRPIELTPNIATKNISSIATADQTEFTVTGGYRINEIAVYRNGVRLADGRDFTASDGDTVNLVTGATVDDVIEFAVFDSFNIAGTIVSAASSQNLNGDLNVTGNLYAGTFEPSNLVSTAATFNSTLHVGSALTANAAGDVETIGIITAGSFSGSGANLTGVASTDNIITGTAATFRNTAVNAGVPNVNIVGLATVGIITAYGALEGTTGTFSGALSGSTGTFSGAVNVDDTTDSTSSTSGALIVDGGLGVAKNVYIGAGLSVAGTLTYEDVTNVDSVGMITAKSGVNVSGGELNVGLGFSVGNAGIITSTGGIIDLKNSGSVSNVKFYCEVGNAHYTALQSAAHSAYSGNVTITLPATTDTLIGKTTTDTLTNKTLTSPTITGTGSLTGGAGDFSSNLTVGSGITMGSAGVATFSGTADVHLTDSVRLLLGTGSDLRITHDGSHGYIQENTGNLRIDADTLQLRSSAGENYLYGAADGAVTLYHDSSAKLATSATGVTITGNATATKFLGDGSALTGVGGDMDITSSLFV